MIINVPQPIKDFVRNIPYSFRKGAARTVARFTAGICLARGKPSFAEIGRRVIRDQRYRGSVSRQTRRRSFRTRDIYTSAVEMTIELEVESKPDGGDRVGRLLSADRETWILAIDDVATSRGGLTKIANGHHLGKLNETPGKKVAKPPTKTHTFVMGLLLTPRGARIPLPRKTWRTKKYARKIRRKYVTKVQLAVQIVKEANRLVPDDVDVVVLGDNLYDSQELSRACGKLGWVLITPADTLRVFSENDGGRLHGHRNLHDHGRSLSSSAFERLVLEPGCEDTASYRRRRLPVGSKARREKRRTYRIAHERRDVTGLGPVGVVYSWKSPVYRSRRCSDRESFMVLTCTNPNLPAQLIVQLYELRWEIELFFRSLKSGLGLATYQGTDFHAFERMVDLTLLSYLFFEWYRISGLADPPSYAHLADLRRTLSARAARDDFRYLERRLGSERGRKDIRRLFRKLGEDAA